MAEQKFYGPKEADFGKSFCSLRKDHWLFFWRSYLVFEVQFFKPTTLPKYSTVLIFQLFSPFILKSVESLTAEFLSKP